MKSTTALLLTLLAVTLSPFGSSATVGLQNGSFESGFAGWTNSPSIVTNLFPHAITATDGTNCIEFGIDNVSGSVLAQSFSIGDGMSYLLSFDIFAMGDAGTLGVLRADISASGNVLVSESFTNNAQSGPSFVFESKTVRFTVPLGVTNVTLRFTDISPNNGFAVDPMLDNVRIIAETSSPIIARQPLSQTAAVGSTAIFTVGVSGEMPSVSSGALRLWLKADTGVVTNGSGAVIQWQDQSGNANHSSQGNTNLQPTLVQSAALGGQPVLRFDGIQNASAGDFLQGTGDVGIPNGYTSFIVYSRADRTILEQVMTMVGVPAAYDAVRASVIYGTEMGFSAWGNDYVSGLNIPAATYRVMTHRLNTNKTLVEYFDTDGTNNFTATNATSGLQTPASGYYIGGLGSQTRNFAGDIAEVIYFQGRLSDTDRVAVESYLKQKYHQSGSISSIAYQWLFNGTNILGGTNASLTLSNVQAADEGNYSVSLSNSFGVTISSNALLTLSFPPVITTQPQSQNVIQGTNVSFSVSASGPSLTFQWQFNGVAISNATESTFSLGNVQNSNAGAYSVRVSNSDGLLVSSTAFLTVNATPQILTQPQSQNVNAGGDVTFGVVLNAEIPAASSGALRLWLKADAGVITNEGGFVSQWQDQSGNANHAFQGNSNLQPKLVRSTAVGGQSALRFDGIQNNSFGDVLRGTGSVGIPDGYTSFLVYSAKSTANVEHVPAWVSNGGGAGAGRAYYIFDQKMAFSSWHYNSYTSFIIPTNTCRIWTHRLNTNRTSLEFFDSTATSSTNINLVTTGLIAPWAGYTVGGIDPQLTEGRHFEGDIAELIYFRGTLSEQDRLAVENYLKKKYHQNGSAGSVTYQWQFNGTNIVGATNSSLSLSNVQPSDAGDYSVIIANLAGSITSSKALLSVVPSPLVPRIQSFSPGFGPVGTTVTIVGENFSPLPSSNIVWFGAVAASVISSQSTQLVVNVPAYASQSPISASVGGLIGISPTSFVITYLGGTFSGSSLTSANNLPTGDGPIGVKIVDLDGDGKGDLVVPNNIDNTISVYRNISTNGALTAGSFAPRINFAVGMRPREVAIGDIDGDGKRDIVVANNGGSTVSVFRNVSTAGTFTVSSLAAKVDFGTGANPHQLALVDLNGDGKLDVATANTAGGTLSILRNTATSGSITVSSFAVKTDFPASAQPVGLAAGDIDGDGKPDLAVGNYGANSLSVFRNTTPVGNTVITLSAKVDFATAFRPFGGLSVGDLDGDAKLDLAVATYGGGTVSVFRNTSTTGVIATNSLASRVDLPTGGSTHAVLTVDIDGDSKSDLVAVSEYANAVSVFRNQGTNGVLVAGSFASRVDFASGWNPGGVAVADLNGDGKPDVVAAASYGNALSLYRNISSASPEIVTHPQSQTVATGTDITLSAQASGAQPLVFQWRVDGTNIIGATNISLTLSNVQPANSGSYSLHVANVVGSAESSNAVLTVLSPASITSHPESQSVLVGDDVAFGISASGDAPLSYQWRFNGENIVGATNSALALTNVQLTNAGTYSVSVANRAGFVVSSNALLTVDIPPMILTQPQSQSSVAGSDVTFNVGLNAKFPTVSSGTVRLWLKADAGVITNAAGVVSQWQDQSDNINHASQTNPNLQPVLVHAATIGGQAAVRFDGIQSAGAGDFLKGIGDVGIPDGYTSFLVYSAKSTANVENIPAWVTHGGGAGAARGYYIFNQKMAFATWYYDSHTSFTIPTNTFRVWTHRLNTNRTVIESFDSTATTSTNINLATSNLLPPLSGYTIGAIDPQQTAGRHFAGDIAELIYFRGTLSESDRLSVESYLKQKYYQIGSVGAVAYQWQFNGTNIASATNSSLTLSNVQPADAGVYSVVIANSVGSTTSSNAILTVNIPPSITAQPQGQFVNAGGIANFSVETAGTGPFTYQWQRNSNNIANATNATLVINSVQTSNAGNYRVLVTSPFGMVASSNAVLAVNISTIRVVNTNAPSARSFALTIELGALGTENAAGFSLSFDPSILTFDSVVLDNGLNGAALISNTAQVGSGKLGIAVALQSDSTFTAGTQALIHVTFNVGVTATAMETAVNFIDSPTTRQISDVGAETLQSIFIDGTVAIAAVNYEGDVAPRPNGSRTLTITDWVQVGRFAAGLDTPLTGEFQRIDSAPRADLGNGVISVTDWVQAGRYAAGVDPLTPVGGPATASAARKTEVAAASEGDRTILLETTNQVGQTHIVSARLVAQGNENAIGFSLAFDPAILKFTGATAGGNAPGALLNVNTNNLAVGRVGVALSLSTGNIFPAGTQEVIRLTFEAATNVTATTALNFTDSPVLREVSDQAANPLAASFASASLIVNPAPLLTINMSEAGTTLSWPVIASNFVLEAASAIGTNWTTVSGNLTTNAQSISTTLPLPEQQQFYRLKQP